jgi:ABC-type lipoprotein release transport system permease subunit
MIIASPRFRNVLLILILTFILLRNVVSVSGLIMTPVRIRLEGRLEYGSITDGSIIVTSGMVTVGNVTFHVSTSPSEEIIERYNGSLNRVTVSSGKLSSTAISLGKSYVIGLAAFCILSEDNVLHLDFGYGDSYPGLTAITMPRSYGRWSISIPIKATGVLTLSENRVTIFAEGAAFLYEEENEESRNGCLIVIRKDAPKGIEAYLPPRSMWRMDIWEDDENYYVAVPQDFTTLFILLRSDSKIAELLRAFGAPSFEGGTGILVNVSCKTGNSSLAYLLTRSLRESLEAFKSQERAFLMKVGFDAEKYLKDVEYAETLLRESEYAFEKGDYEVGGGLLEKAVVKANTAVETLSQAKTDCVTMFLFLITFTFFLSSLVSAMIEKKKAFINIMLFVILVLIELALIPQARMTIHMFNPEILFKLTPTSLALSLSVAVITLLVVGMLVLEAKGSLLSDLFWYSVKSIRKRMLRAVLTIVTIAVVSAVSGSLLAVGTVFSTKEEAYLSGFRGLSISSHVTVTTYIFRGLDQANEFIVNEFFEPMPEFQVKWLSEMVGVEKKYIVGISPVFVSKNGQRIRASLVATNASTLDGTVIRGTMISEGLAKSLGIREGDSIIIVGRDVTMNMVNGILKEPIKLMDGVPLDEVEGPFVLTGLESTPQPSTVYRLILEGSFPSDLAKKLVETSYERNSTFITLGGAQITQRTFRSLRACLGAGNETRSLLISGEFEQFVGTPELLVLIGLSSLMIVIALLGSLYERQKEYSTISALGASPGRVSLLMFVEGLSYGLIGGVLGYVLSQFLQVYVSNPVSPIRPYTFSSMLASFIIAIVSSIIGSLIPARRVILKVVPSRFLFKKIEEAKLFEDRAEAMIPLRIIGDANDFLTYVSSFTKRPPPMSWGPIYMKVTPHEERGRVDMVEMVLSYRGERVAMYRVQLLLPENPGITLKAVAYSATGEWGIDHKYCAREMLTALREDLLQYVDWKKQLSKETY